MESLCVYVLRDFKKFYIFLESAYLCVQLQFTHCCVPRAQFYIYSVFNGHLGCLLKQP